MSLVKEFSTYGQAEFGVENVGGKIASLVRMIQQGFPVPPGIAIEVEAFRMFVASSPLLTQLIEEVDQATTADEISEMSEAIKSAVAQTPMPLMIEQQIRAFVESDTRIFAVRSSATAEDLPEASFAGQQDTILGVRGVEAILDAVKKCWASLFNARAIMYRNQNQFSHKQVGIAVAVQVLVQSECAGIMFMQNPVTGDRNQIHVDAGWGLGEYVVGGHVTPDTYHLDKQTLQLIDLTVSPQEFQLCWNGSGTEQTEVPERRRHQQKLSLKKLRQLAAMGKKLEAYCGGIPQDIEWAFVGKKLWLLQSRPVTTKNHHGFQEEPEVVEAMPLISKGFAASPGVIYGTVKIVITPADCGKVQPGDIMVAPWTNPDYMPGLVVCSGVLTEIGGVNSHASIVAREYGKVAVVGATDIISQLYDGQHITLDGSHGKVYLGHAQATIEWGERRAARIRELAAEVEALETELGVLTIAADPAMADQIAAGSNDGVGLLRLELVLQNTVKAHPRHFIKHGKQEEYIAMVEQAILKFARAFAPRPVVVRFTDFKTNEYKELVGSEEFEREEENPMMGLRGALRYLTDPQSFALECEAMRRVFYDHGFNNLIMMFPFVRTPEELAKAIALAESFGLRREDGVKFWMMVELPVNVILLENFVEQGVVGLSVGGNDLFQLTYGADRDGVSEVQQYSEVHEGILWLVQETGRRVRALREAGVDVYLSYCGNAPSNHDQYAGWLSDWGYDSVSVHPDKVSVVRINAYNHEQSRRESRI